MARGAGARSAAGRSGRGRPRILRSVAPALLTLVAAAALWVLVPAVRTATSLDGAGAGTVDGGVPVDPGAFSSGACVSLPPTHGDNGRTVFLDAGHGGVDPGAVGTTQSGATVDEASATLPVELDAADRLRALGYRVVVSRTGDTSVARLTAADVDGGVLSLQGAHDDVVARDLCADRSGAQLLVGIYFDSGDSPDDAGSLTTYDAARPFAAANLRFADLLQQDVLAAMNAQGWGIPDGGVQPDSEEGSLVTTSSESPLAQAAAGYGHVLLLGPAMAGYFTTPSTMPGALIEPLFVTDPFEGTLAASTQGREVVAGGIARAVEQYFAPAAAGSPASPKG